MVLGLDEYCKARFEAQLMIISLFVEVWKFVKLRPYRDLIDTKGKTRGNLIKILTHINASRFKLLR